MMEEAGLNLSGFLKNLAARGIENQRKESEQAGPAGLHRRGRPSLLREVPHPKADDLDRGALS